MPPRHIAPCQHNTPLFATTICIAVCSTICITICIAIRSAICAAIALIPPHIAIVIVNTPLFATIDICMTIFSTIHLLCYLQHIVLMRFAMVPHHISIVVVTTQHTTICIALHYYLILCCNTQQGLHEWPSQCHQGIRHGLYQSMVFTELF